MNRCEFCPKYNPGFGGEEPKCEYVPGSSYCDEAVERMSEVLKSMKIAPKPKMPEGYNPSDEDVKKLMTYFFGI